MSTAPETVYDVVGESGIQRLVRAFYARVPADEILGPMYPTAEMAESERRLLGFLTYRLGGPDHYIAERGAPRLRMRHAPFVINQAARDRWLSLMSHALQEARFPPDITTALTQFFAETATFLINSD